MCAKESENILGGEDTAEPSLYLFRDLLVVEGYGFGDEGGGMWTGVGCL